MLFFFTWKGRNCEQALLFSSTGSRSDCTLAAALRAAACATLLPRRSRFPRGCGDRGGGRRPSSLAGGDISVHAERDVDWRTLSAGGGRRAAALCCSCLRPLSAMCDGRRGLVAGGACVRARRRSIGMRRVNISPFYMPARRLSNPVSRRVWWHLVLPSDVSAERWFGGLRAEISKAWRRSRLPRTPALPCCALTARFTYLYDSASRHRISLYGRTISISRRRRARSA